MFPERNSTTAPPLKRDWPGRGARVPRERKLLFGLRWGRRWLRRVCVLVCARECDRFGAALALGLGIAGLDWLGLSLTADGHDDFLEVNPCSHESSLDVDRSILGGAIAVGLVLEVKSLSERGSAIHTATRAARRGFGATSRRRLLDFARRHGSRLRLCAGRVKGDYLPKNR